MILVNQPSVKGQKETPGSYFSWIRGYLEVTGLAFVGSSRGQVHFLRAGAQ